MCLGCLIVFVWFGSLVLMIVVLFGFTLWFVTKVNCFSCLLIYDSYAADELFGCVVDGVCAR